VVRGSLERSHKRLEQSGRVDLNIVNLVENRAEQFEDYFSHIEATPFLDDITSKNVIVNGGRLSGIVDVDWMGFGDSIATLALTRMSLMALGYGTDYVEYWAEELKLSGEQHRVLDVYAAACCLDFISDATSETKVARLQEILKHLLAEL
jgi:aminoglycoside phosphotransferase